MSRLWMILGDTKDSDMVGNVISEVLDEDSIFRHGDSVMGVSPTIWIGTSTRVGSSVENIDSCSSNGTDVSHTVTRPYLQGTSV